MEGKERLNGNPNILGTPLRKVAYYTVTFFTFLVMAVILCVMILGYLGKTDSLILKDSFLNSSGDLRDWVWFWSAWIIGPVLAELLIIRTR
jgi:hypothetical protein